MLALQVTRTLYQNLLLSTSNLVSPRISLIPALLIYLQKIQLTRFAIPFSEVLISSHTPQYLLSGLLLKANAPLGAVSLTDIYGTLISSRLFIPTDINTLDPDNLSLHKFRRFVDDGAMPLPIFTAIQHEIPAAPAKPLQEAREQREYLIDSSRYEMLKEEEKELESKTRWLWFEFTPYEVGCDELGVSWVALVALCRCSSCYFLTGVDTQLESRPSIREWQEH
jgi:phospholipase A2